jgi:micrococcal nuclease
MMSKLSKLLIILIVVSMLAGCFTACDVVNGLLGGEQPDTNETPDDGTTPDDGNNENEEPAELVDFVGQLKFDPNSGRAWAYAEVESYIDGDTTHFRTTDGTQIGDAHYVKARYLAINTPESTGVIEPWGKKAATFTKTQLLKATSIIIESDTNTWDVDSTGGRYLLWIWYKTSEDGEYRNLNLEILQEGLAFGSSVGSNVYGETGLQILNQAKTQKLHVFSKAKDPDFYYGKAVEVSLKELKANTYWSEEDNRFVNKYEGLLVKFEAVVAKQADTTIYVEEYDAENDMYFGMQLFAGYSYPRMTDFALGNRLSIVGTLQYYENGATYQISNLKCEMLNPTSPQATQVLSKNNPISYRELDIDTLLNDKIVLETIKETETEDGEIIEELVKQEFKYSELAHYSTAVMKNLTVVSVYETDSETDSDGALTITCVDAQGNKIDVRTAQKLIREDGTVVTKSDIKVGEVISVKGVIDFYKPKNAPIKDGKYQIRVFSINDITFE